MEISKNNTNVTSLVVAFGLAVTALMPFIIPAISVSMAAGGMAGGSGVG